MKKVFISIYECVPGMTIAETIYNEFGAVVIAENTILDTHLITKLENLGNSRIRIYNQQDYAMRDSSTVMFQAQYNDNIDTIKEILHDISNGNEVDTGKVDSISDSIMLRINENRDIVGCINQIRRIDEYTYTHCMNVSLLSMLIAKWLKYDIWKVKNIIQAGLLHDVGKTMVAVDIINKTGSLTPEEFGEIKKHPVYGYRMLKQTSNISAEVCTAVLMHHEREDGTGYPVGLKSAQIHDFAKIVAIADVYDAMTSDRSYRQKTSPFQVFEFMEDESFGLYNPKILNIFLKNIAAYYIGDMVRLNTGETGEIVYINQMHISQPLVKVRDSIIDLSDQRTTKIVELL